MGDGDPKVTKSSSIYAGGQTLTVEDQMLDVLNNHRLSENAKVAELQKATANLSEPEKQKLYERLSDRKSKDPLVQQFHYRLSHHSDKAGGVSTTDQVLNTLKPAGSKQTEQTQTAKAAAPGKGASPALTDPKTANALARDRVLSQAATGLKPGETISAMVTAKNGESTFEFSKPVSKDQAASIIFQNGKIPDNAKLLQGSGNKWTVQYPKDAESRQNVASHFNSHTETLITRDKFPGEMYQPDPIMKFSWVGGARQTTNAGPPRRDLKNDYGFVISKRYEVDEGQSSHMNVRKMITKGPGYEMVFEKPMTKDQVKEKLFEKDVKDSQIRLVPVPQEPTPIWQVQLMDYQAPLKKPAAYAIQDSNTFAKESTPPGLPDGIKAHIAKQTVPNNAKKFPPDVYVWEDDGHIIRVQTNGKKGKDGYYNYEQTSIQHDDESGKNTMRWLMMERGLPVREAWQGYIKHWDELHLGMLGMVGAAGRFMPRGGSTASPRSSFQEPIGVRSRMRGPSGTVIENPPPVRPRPPATEPPVESAPQQAADGKNIVPGRGKTWPGAVYRKLGGIPDPVPAPEWLPNKSGVEITNAQVKELHGSDRGRIGWSMSKAEHLRQWKSANPNSTEDPPTSFTTRDGRVQVSEEKWIQSGEKPLWGTESD